MYTVEKVCFLGNINGVPPTNIVIFGAGTVGEFAARTGLGMGAIVKVFDNSVVKLRNLQKSFGYQHLHVYFTTKNH